MVNFFLYLAESSIILGVLYVLYAQLFYKETYFEWNRIYLISIILISLLLPLVPIPYTLIESSNWLLMQSIESFEQDSQNYLAIVSVKTHEQTAQTMFLQKLLKILTWLYFSIAFYFFIVFFKNIIQLYILKSQHDCTKDGKYCIISSLPVAETFSFFKNIYLGKKFYSLSEKEQQQILQHEKIHVNQYHTLDILFVEIIKIFFWFNPVVWFLQQKIKEIHEFIVDSHLAKVNFPSEYSKLILKLSIKNINNYLKSSFSDSKIKDRILMLASKESLWLRKRKFLIGLPLLFFVLISFALAKSLLLAQNSPYTFSKKEFNSPVPLHANVLTPFFINKTIKKKIKKGNDWFSVKYQVSHKQVSFASFTDMPVRAIENGKVLEIKKKEEWGVSEYEIRIKHSNNFESIYKNLSQCLPQINDSVAEGALLAKMGDERIYKVVNFKLLKNHEPVNPLNYIQY